jgi:metal-responsive CopG/Arc/MetJ family transcriptional regulator
MTSILLRIPEQLLAKLDQIADETYSNRSSLIRQSIVRNLDIIRNVELPAIRDHYRRRIPNLHQ